MYTAPTFEQEINEALDNGYVRVVIDLTACEFLDSTALGILVSANQRLGEQKDRLTLVTADHNIVKTFQITGLDRRFTIVPTRGAP
jgi:anti-sigma B factor antagonist